ncbi:sensor histidine kinase [Dyadobacter sp. CY312]|uniref:sensor histidine kinase n=1 Tax=Dyadobacter sp. CY312 TaxID=2907303 RepID=UPI001F3EEB5F|nr:sensor histidine kinase [Dyadobacter sp. CY312]MCE7040043.1 ATP-binding protein [Dyadobacter sp. CY312]
MRLLRSITEQKLSWLVRFLLGTSLLLIIGLSYSYHTINKQLLYFSEKVSHTQRVITALKETSSGLYEITFLTNSFLFLRDTTYINKSLAAIASFPEITYKLDTLVSDNAVQKRRIRMLHRNLEVFYTQSAVLLKPDVIALNPISFYASYTSLGNETTSIRKLISEMTDTETMLLQSRIQSKEIYSKQIFRYNWLILLVTVVFLSTAFVLLDRELVRNKMYRVDLENKIENLNRSNAELEQFAYVASHDMKEPLRKIRSFADRTLIKYGKDLPDDVNQMMIKIDNSSQRMQLLITDLLSFSRTVNTGTTPKSISLNIPFAEARANLSEIISESNAIIHCEPLPTVEVYPSQMVQLFQNLLANSIKYHKENQSPVIHIRYKLVSGEVIPNVQPAHRDIRFHKIEVIDNGIGFDKKFAEKIFVIFQRLHDRSKFEGTGIGLAICKRVVSNHNGYIFAESMEGKGASLHVYLPLESLLT